MSSEVVPFRQLEIMASSIVKSGFFGVKTNEQALTLLMIAEADGIKPIQAVMEYDVIGGKPALKAYAMLGRYQRAGGIVEWLEASDEKVSGRFTHPAGGSVVVTWDTARVQAAGLMRNALHKTNPQQMKRARCISEGVRATYPSCIPAGVYSSEEAKDIEVHADDRAPINVAAVIDGASNPGLSQSLVDELDQQMKSATDLVVLRATFGVAYQAAKGKSDEARKEFFTRVYEARKAEITEAANAIAAAVEAKKTEGEQQI